MAISFHCYKYLGRKFQKTVDHQEYRHTCAHTIIHTYLFVVVFLLPFKKMSEFSESCQETFLIPFAKYLNFNCDWY